MRVPSTSCRTQAPPMPQPLGSRPRPRLSSPPTRTLLRDQAALAALAKHQAHFGGAGGAASAHHAPRNLAHHRLDAQLVQAAGEDGRGGLGSGWKGRVGRCNGTLRGERPLFLWLGTHVAARRYPPPGDPFLLPTPEARAVHAVRPHTCCAAFSVMSWSTRSSARIVCSLVHSSSWPASS